MLYTDAVMWPKFWDIFLEAAIGILECFNSGLLELCKGHLKCKAELNSYAEKTGYVSTIVSCVTICKLMACKAGSSVKWAVIYVMYTLQ